MKKKHKNIIAIFITAIIIYGIYYVAITIPTRHDCTLISDLSKTNKILITLARYDFICFKINAKDERQKLEFNSLELVLKAPNGKTMFSTHEYNSGVFSPRFYSAPQASPPILGSNVMALYLKPEVPFELEIKYHGKDNKNVLQGASLEMMASSKIKYGYSDKHFSVKPINNDK